MKYIKYLLIILFLLFAILSAWFKYSSHEYVFTGKLESVNTGCFYDAECFVVVDGEHVTAITGWSQEVVGSVQGLKEGEGFGDLEKYIGQDVEVFAIMREGKFTLYGNEKYYIKVK